MNKNVYSISDIKNLVNSQKSFLEEKYRVNNIFLFGSYAKNLQTPDSDIDLLVSFIEPIDMFEFIDLQDYLSELFQKTIDLGTPNSLKSTIKNEIMNEAIAL